MIQTEEFSRQVSTLSISYRHHLYDAFYYSIIFCFYCVNIVSIKLLLYITQRVLYNIDLKFQIVI